MKENENNPDWTLNLHKSMFSMERWYIETQYHFWLVNPGLENSLFYTSPVLAYQIYLTYHGKSVKWSLLFSFYGNVLVWIR